METMESIETMQTMKKFAKYKINLLKTNAIKRAKEQAKKEKEQAKQQYISKCNEIKKELETKITKIKTMQSMLTNEEIIMCQMMDKLLEAATEEEKKVIKEKIKLIQKITKIHSQIYLLYYIIRRKLK